VLVGNNPVPQGKETVTQTLPDGPIKLFNEGRGWRLNKRHLDIENDIDWQMTIGSTRVGFIDIELAERHALKGCHK